LYSWFAKAILKNTNLKSFDSVMLSSPLAGLLLFAPNPEEYLNEVAERKKGIYRINLYNCDEFCSPKCKACYNKEPNCQ